MDIAFEKWVPGGGGNPPVGPLLIERGGSSIVFFSYLPFATVGLFSGPKKKLSEGEQGGEKLRVLFFTYLKNPKRTVGTLVWDV